MSSASVELIIDRRFQERRSRSDAVQPERRQRDRRAHREKEALQKAGWVRLEVD